MTTGVKYIRTTLTIYTFANIYTQFTFRQIKNKEYYYSEFYKMHIKAHLIYLQAKCVVSHNDKQALSPSKEMEGQASPLEH